MANLHSAIIDMITVYIDLLSFLDFNSTESSIRLWENWGCPLPVEVTFSDHFTFFHFIFYWSTVPAQYYISYRCIIQWFTIFKGNTPLIVIIKYWLYSSCCAIYPCSLFYTCEFVIWYFNLSLKLVQTMS